MVPLLIGMKGFAEHYRDYKIYKKIRTGVIFSIIGYAVLPLMLLAVLSYYFSLYNDSPYSPAMWFGHAPFVLLSNVVSYAFILVMAICFRQSFNGLADRSGKRLFHTAGTTMFIGVIVTFVLYIGACISVIPLPIASARAILSELTLLFSLSNICSSFVVSVTFMIFAVLFFTLKTNPNTPSHSYPLSSAT